MIEMIQALVTSTILNGLNAVLMAPVLATAIFLTSLLIPLAGIASLLKFLSVRTEHKEEENVNFYEKLNSCSMKIWTHRLPI